MRQWKTDATMRRQGSRLPSWLRNRPDKGKGKSKNKQKDPPRERSPLRQARHPEQPWDREEESASESPVGPVRLRERGEDRAASHQAEGVNTEQEASEPRTVTLAEGPGAHNMPRRKLRERRKRKTWGKPSLCTFWCTNCRTSKGQGQRSIGLGRSNWSATQRQGKAYSLGCFPS